MSRDLLSDPRVREALREYERVHWGERGDGKAHLIGAPNPFVGPLTELGELVSIVYKTTKRGDGPSEYEHEFERVRPRLSFHPKAGLFIVGGDYRVTVRGIVG